MEATECQDDGTWRLGLLEGPSRPGSASRIAKVFEEPSVGTFAIQYRVSSQRHYVEDEGVL